MEDDDYDLIEENLGVKVERRVSFYILSLFMAITILAVNLGLVKGTFNQRL